MLNTFDIRYLKDDDEWLFEKIVQDIQIRGFSVTENALSADLTDLLHLQVSKMDSVFFNQAGIGRGQNFNIEDSVRSDEIVWIDNQSIAGKRWLDWAEDLKNYLNRRLFLGLFTFESHFATYHPGAYYQRHVDAFKGEANRVLSIVVYMNKDWMPEDGGALVLYRNIEDKNGIQVFPAFGTLAVFLSEDFPHEVKPTNRERFSIAGWFRVNTSIGNKFDPSR